MPIFANKKKRLIINDDEGTFVDIPIIDGTDCFQTAEGSGLGYQYYNFSIFSGQDFNASRIIARQKVHHFQRKADDDPDDDEQFAWAEVIIGFRTTEQGGLDYVKTGTIYNPNGPTNGRLTYIARIFNKDDEGIWADVERDCQYTTQANSGLEFQRTITKIHWDPDPKSPFNVDDSIIADPVVEGMTDGPALRLGPFQRLININGSNAVEFETDTNDPHGDQTGVDLPQAAVLHQVETGIADSGKLTIDLSFNIAKEGNLLVKEGTFDYIPLLQFGGNGGFAQSSLIALGRIREVEDSSLSLIARFVGPFKEIDWNRTPNFYGVVFGEQSRKFASLVRVDAVLRKIYGGPNTSDNSLTNSFANFTDKWHSVQISIDVSDGQLTAFPTDTIYNWIFECDGAWDPGGPPFVFSNPLHSSNALTDAGIIVDPDNSIYTADTTVLDQRPLALSPQFFPDPALTPSGRIFVYSIDVDGHTSGVTGATIGTAFTSFPQTILVTPPDIPFQMLLDGYTVVASKKVFSEAQDPTTEGGELDDGDGILLNNSELSMPRQKGPRPNFDTTDFGGGDAWDVRQRRGRCQVWFDKYADLSALPTEKRFITRSNKTDPKTQVVTKIIKLAQLSAEDKALLATLGIDQKTILSPAGMPNALGKPDLFFKGSHDAFIVNRGSGGAFVEVNDIESYGPGPGEILDRAK